MMLAELILTDSFAPYIEPRVGEIVELAEPITKEQFDALEDDELIGILFIRNGEGEYQFARKEQLKLID